MKKINLYLFCGNMLSGKTSLLEQIRKQNKDSDEQGIIFLDEQNFYKNFLLSREKVKQVIDHIDEKAFHFQVQTFLLNNFVNVFDKKIFEFNESVKTEIDIICDTFPPITGFIFSNAKEIYNLISKSHFELLKKKYLHSFNLLSLLFDRVKQDGDISFNVVVFFRKVPFDFSLELLKKRNEEEYNFYTNNESYFRYLHEKLGDEKFFKSSIIETFADVCNYTSGELNFVLQNIEKEMDFRAANEFIFQYVYKLNK